MPASARVAANVKIPAQRPILTQLSKYRRCLKRLQQKSIGIISQAIGNYYLWPSKNKILRLFVASFPLPIYFNTEGTPAFECSCTLRFTAF
jgi:hypothetical protein